MCARHARLQRGAGYSKEMFTSCASKIRVCPSNSIEDGGAGSGTGVAVDWTTSRRIGERESCEERNFQRRVSQPIAHIEHRDIS